MDELKKTTGKCANTSLKRVKISPVKWHRVISNLNNTKV